MASLITERPSRLVTAQKRVEVEESLQQLSRYLDGLFHIPLVGWRFGLDALVGLVPGAGDWLTAVVSLYILTAAVRYRVPKITILRMALNIVIDFALGALPFVGDALDFFWKSNRKNLRLLVERAELGADEERGGSLSDWLFVGVIIVGLFFALLASLGISGYILYWVFRTTPLF
jgi:hypothetical protein